MTESRAEDVVLICPVCGKPCPEEGLSWSVQSDDQPCCARCLAEEESCGCSDD